MIRQSMIALGVIALGVGYEGIGLATIQCPPAPEQTSRDYTADISGVITKFKRFLGVEVKAQAATVAKDLLGKLPGADRVYVEQMMYATFCSALNEDKALADSERRKELREYHSDVRKAMEHQTSTEKQTTNVAPPMQSGKVKGSVEKLRVNPSSTPPSQPKTKQSPMQKPQLAEAQSPTISQYSKGANSPNITGDQNVVILNSARDRNLEKWMLRQRHLDQLQSLLRREADNFVVIADRARTVGRISNLNNGTEPDVPEVEQLLLPEVLSPDLANHYPEYWQKKQQLLKDILGQDTRFGDTVALVSTPVYLPSHAENRRVTVGHAFLDRCMGHGPGIAVEKYKNGGYSYRILQGGGSSTAGDVPEDVIEILEAFQSISPTAETAKRCEALTKGAASISVKAKELSLMAKRLAERTALAGDCEYTKLD